MKKRGEGGEEILKPPTFPKQIFLPPTDAMHPSPQVSFLHLEEVELVKQNPVIITGQLRPADQGRKTLPCNPWSIRTASLEDPGAVPSSVCFPQPWPASGILRVGALSPLEDADANVLCCNLKIG